MHRLWGCTMTAAHVPGVEQTKTREAEFDDLLDETDADEAAAVLWHFGGRGARRPGRFVESLLVTLSHADPGNRALLATAFPGLSHAFEIAANEPFGLTLLSRVAEGGA